MLQLTVLCFYYKYKNGEKERSALIMFIAVFILRILITWFLMNGEEMNFHGPFFKFCHGQIEKLSQKQ